MSATVLRPSSAIPPEPSWRFTVDEYHRMIETGLLTGEDRVELVEGWILPKMSHKPPHAVVIGTVEENLQRRLPSGWFLRSQLPITTSDSEPEPDIAVVRGRRKDYMDRHPGPGDIGLVIEVSKSRLDFDRQTKARIYARAGIPIYWIVNVDAKQIEVFADPDSMNAKPNYRSRRTYSSDESVSLTLDGTTIAEMPVAEMF